MCSQSFQVALQQKDFYKMNPGSSSQCLSCGQIPKDKFSTKSSQWSLLLQGQEFRGPLLPCELPGWGFCNEVIVKSWLTDDLPSAALGAGWGVLRKTLTLPVFLAAGWGMALHCYSETSPVAFLAGKALGYSADRLCSVASGGANRLDFPAKGNTVLASVPELGGNYLACLSSEAGSFILLTASPVVLIPPNAVTLQYSFSCFGEHPNNKIISIALS